MNIIITMGGLGSRFAKAGYTKPKYMIEARGKSLFDWSMESLEGYREVANRYVFLARTEDGPEGFIRERADALGIRNVEFVGLDHLTDGQATTALLGLDHCDSAESIMIYNIDTYVEPGEMKYTDISGDGHIPCFHAPGDHWSFARLDDAGRVVEVREKQRISDNCTLGAYYFSSADLYRRMYDEYYSDASHLEKGERYVAPLYNHMISKGLEVTISIVDAEKVHVLGTPEELHAFEEGA